MSEQLALFAEQLAPAPSNQFRQKPARKPIRLKLVPKSSVWGIQQYTRGRYDYRTPDGRWFIESNWWRGGQWCVFDLSIEADRLEQATTWAFDDTGIDPIKTGLTPLAGTVVQSLDQAKELIAGAPTAAKAVTK